MRRTSKSPIRVACILVLHLCRALRDQAYAGAAPRSSRSASPTARFRLGSRDDGRAAAEPMLTKDLLFGFNLVTLAGFAVMAIGFNLGRAARGRGPPGFAGGSARAKVVWGWALMGVGTALVFLGIYLGGGLR
jgi:hypothetical protein